MDIRTIKGAVRQSLTADLGKTVKQRPFVDPDNLMAQREYRRRRERECGRLEAEIIQLERERDRAARLNAQLTQEIEELSDGFFGAERLVNREELRKLRRQQAAADQRAKELGQEIANRRGKLSVCREDLGKLI